jgi:hypothetical protein
MEYNLFNIKFWKDYGLGRWLCSKIKTRHIKIETRKHEVVEVIYDRDFKVIKLNDKIIKKLS